MAPGVGRRYATRASHHMGLHEEDAQIGRLVDVPGGDNGQVHDGRPARAAPL